MLHVILSLAASLHAKVYKARTLGVSTTITINAQRDAARVSLRGIGVHADGDATLRKDAISFDHAFAAFLERKRVKISRLVDEGGALLLSVWVPLFGQMTIRLLEDHLPAHLSRQELS